MPPTVKPPPWATAVFACVSVVRIASAASSPPWGESAAAAASTPASTRSIGIGAPITPVERTSTCSGARPSRPAARSAVAIASASPCAPVAAFAMPELITTACGSALSRWRFDTTTGAASTRFCVHIAAPVASGTERTIARSRFSLRMCACTPDATKPTAAVTLIRALRSGAGRPSRRGRARGSRSAPPARRRPCRGCRSRRSRLPCRSRASAKTPISAASVSCTRASSGVTPSGSTRTTALPAYASSSSERTSASVWR